MADDKITRSKLSEKDRKDTEDDQQVGANISGVPKPKDTSKEKSKARAQAENTEEGEAKKKKLNELQIGVGDHAKGSLERETNKSARGKEIASEIQSSETEMPMKTDDEKSESAKAEAESFSGGECVISSDLTKSEEELKQSESCSSICLDAGTTFEGLAKQSGFDLEIDTNMEGLAEEMYEVVLEARKGKAKLDEGGKELDDDPEGETSIDRLVKAIRELYREVTKGNEGKLERLMKNKEEYSSGDEEESESESDRKCEMLLKTPLRLMLKLDIEIRRLVEELEELLIALKDDDEAAGAKLRALRDELEALKLSNYEKEVELIGKVKELIGDGAAEGFGIDEVLKSEVDPMVEKAKEIIARVKSEIEEVEEIMDRNKSSDAAEN